jgi:antirestriction protein ArdC
MTRPTDPARPDVYTRITQQILAQLEAGVRPWTQPWKSATSVSRPLRHDGTPYNGINIVLLWGEATGRGFTRSTSMTFRQALALGAHVRKGERGATVVYANQIVREDIGETGEGVEQRIPFLKAYTVFNVDQIDGLPDRYGEPEVQGINAGRTDRACRSLLPELRRGHPSRRRERLLRPGAGPCADAAVRMLRGCRRLLQYPRP